MAQLTRNSTELQLAEQALHPKIKYKKPHFSTNRTRNAVSCISICSVEDIALGQSDMTHVGTGPCITQT
eukprot:2106911-Rhodomonas_salina.3